MKYLLVFCFFFLSLGVTAQSIPSRESRHLGEIWFGLQFGITTGEFEESIDRRLAYGGNLGGVWNPSKKNDFIQLGAEMGLLYMGKDKVEIQGLPLKTTNTLLTTHMVVRLRVQTESWIKPYVDLLGGGKFITTTTQYDNTIFDTIFDVEDESIFQDETNGAWSYGIGMGFSARRKSVGVEFRVLYLPGTSMTYTAPKDLREDSEGNYYYNQRSIPSTDMIFPQLSVSFDITSIAN